LHHHDSQPAAVAAQAAQLKGVRAVVVFEGDVHRHPIAAATALQIASSAHEFTHVLGPSTTFGKDLMPRIAGEIGVGHVSDIMSVEGERLVRTGRIWPWGA
jgi:electron transfer flavoprotein alpha subunit